MSRSNRRAMLNSVFVSFTILAIACAGTETSGSRKPQKIDGGISGAGGADSGSGGALGKAASPSTSAGGSSGTGAAGRGAASGGTSGSSGGRPGSAGAGNAGGANGTIFCGVETCGPETKCCPSTGHCYDPKMGAGCVGIGCAVAKCVGPGCPAQDAAPQMPDCCPAGTRLCSSTNSCVHDGCQNCCPPDVECNQQSDCPSGFSCCYNSRRCYNPLIDQCGGGPPKCAADGSCPGDMTCCTLHGICYEPGCKDCCPTSCAPPTAHCSASLPCCSGGTCCSGVPVSPGNEFCAGNNSGCPISDQNAKHDITPVDPDQVLERVATLPIRAWTYDDAEPAGRHIGPMAQDFHDAFGTGDTDKCIPTVDANGVALAAIQALYRRVENLDEQSRALRRENSALRRELQRLRKE